MNLLRVYRWLNVLSLDVAVGAMVSALFFVKLANVSIRPAGLGVLGLAVWVIYTTDHLLDVRHLSRPASTLRHRLHQQFFLEILIAVLLALSVIGVLLFFIRPEVFQWGLVLLVLVIFYLLIHRYLNYLKELVVALFYLAGVLLPALVQTDSVFGLLRRPECILFLLLALSNLLLFSWYEMKKDKQDGHQSFAIHFGKHLTHKVITGLFISQAFVLCYLFYTRPVLSMVAPLLAMSIGLFLLLLFPRYFSQQERYRLMGDAVFLFPALALIL